MNIKDYVRLATKVINLIFWMILGYLAGDKGMGFYYLAFILFMVVATVFSGGIKQAVARMVAVRRSKGLHYNSKLIFRYGIIYSILGGGIIGFLLWTLAGRFYGSVVGYYLPESVLSVLGIYFVIYSLRGCLQGYYQGRGNTLICIIAELAQDIVMLILCPIVVIKMYRYGMKVSGLLKNPLYSNVNAAIGAVLVQCAVGILCILILVIGDRIAGTVDRYEYNSVKGVDNRRNITISFLKYSGAYIIEHLSPILTIAMILIIYTVNASRSGIEAGEVFSGIGVFSGKFLVVIGFVMAFFTEFADREVKKIRIDVSHDEHKNVRIRILYLIRNSVLILLPLTSIVIILAGPISTIFFGGRMSAGATMLRQGGIVVLFGGLTYVCKGILSTVKMTMYNLISTVAGLAVTLICAESMAGTSGATVMMTVSYLLGMFTQAAILLFVIIKTYEFDVVDLGIKVGKIAVASLVFIGLCAMLDNFIIMNILFFIITVLIAYAAYIVTLAVIKGVGIRDINSLKGTLIYYPLWLIGNYFIDR